VIGGVKRERGRLHAVLQDHSRICRPRLARSMSPSFRLSSVTMPNQEQSFIAVCTCSPVCSPVQPSGSCRNLADLFNRDYSKLPNLAEFAEYKELQCHCHEQVQTFDSISRPLRGRGNPRISAIICSRRIKCNASADC
jgi:hypothetical protein